MHHLQDITTFTVYITACHLDKSFSLYKTVEITSDFQFTSTHITYPSSIRMAEHCEQTTMQIMLHDST